MSLACVGFGFAGSAWTLGVSRLFQGIGSTLSWAGGFTWLVAVTPRERRGQTLGTAIGAAVFGAIFGPVLGGAAAVVGTRPTFVAVSVVGAILVGWTLTTPDAEPEPQPLSRSSERHFSGRASSAASGSCSCRPFSSGS